ncbi:MAG: SpoIIE family protein phosphatase [Candidatus Cloacimonetes bacterium]|nr:SpoIIE family protein phosphatase [Candidatus Cloacimonadota bacterium]
MNEVTMLVAFESERIARVISEMERNAVDLALVGRQYYLYGEHNSEQGISISVENFTAFTESVGGGIWFEPYVFGPLERYVGFYAAYDTVQETVLYKPEYETAEYDFHSRVWYQKIKTGSLAAVEDPQNIDRFAAIWTAPYSGLNALMTTVGVAIWDDEGNFIGMSTVDWVLQSKIDRLSTIRPTENSFVVLACPVEKIIITNTHPDFQGIDFEFFDLYSQIEEVTITNLFFNEIDYISFSKSFDNNWILSIQIPLKEIFMEVETRNNQFIKLFALSFLFLIIITYLLISKFVNKPVKRLTNEVIELGSGNLDKQIEINSKDEIGTLAQAFNKMTIELKNSIEKIAKERAEKERIGTELNIANQIQNSMLPCIFPAFPDRDEFDIYGYMLPAKEVGGDFYDFFFVDENTLALVIADVSGKGIPAALFMVIAKTLLKNNAQLGKNPKEVFETVNNLLAENNAADMFVTAFLGYLDLITGKLIYVNAGHNPPLYCPLHENCEEQGAKKFPGKNGFVLAARENKEYHLNEITIKPGDKLFLYTDGITEAHNPTYDLFGDDRLIETVNQYINLPLKEIAESVKAEIDNFAMGTEQSDDITMLIFELRIKN